MPDRLAEATGVLLDRYALERELGRGGMAWVYLARDQKLDRLVAVKILHAELQAALGPERFLREIEVCSRLSHPHILPLHDAGEVAGRLFYVMPYVDGESLRQHLKRERQLGLEEMLAIVRAVASALDYAHTAGVIHRDIKPENILLARDPASGSLHPLVADFGLARAVDAAGGERLTETGLALGTPAYMSPEQGAPGEGLDGRSDVYALGCVAYEMLAGTPPFTGPTGQAILARHAVDPVPPLRTVRTRVPVAVEQAIERALAKVPADRFATAGEFAAALQMGQAPSVGRRHWRSGRWRALVLGSVAVLAGVAVAVGSWRRAHSPAVAPAAVTMAVLPFSSGGSDTSLDRLGRDLATTISASLDGVGGIRTADRLTVATAAADHPTLSAAEAGALGRRVGASSVLRGTLVRAGDLVRLDAGLYRTEGMVPLAEGITLSGHRDSIGALTDSAAWAVLRRVWQRGTPPSPSLAAVTTHSLPALRAFLDGERELGANHWDQAALAYRSAIAADSTFGMAHFRYALAEEWQREPIEQPVLAALKRYEDGFPERERLLTDAFLTPGGNITLRVERYRAVTRRFPDYWPGWFLYADILSHGGTAAVEWSEGLEAFQRTVAFNPSLVPAWEHLFRYALSRRPAEAARALSRLTQLGWPPADQPETSLAYRLMAGVAAGEGNVPAELNDEADSLVALMAASTNEGLTLVAAPLMLLGSGFPAAQVGFNRRALEAGHGSPHVIAALRAANAWAWATRGRWDSALVAIREAARTDPGELGPTFPKDLAGCPPRRSCFPGRPVLAIESYGLAVLGAWLGTLDPASAIQLRPAAAAAPDRLDNVEDRQDARGRVAWLDGLLAYARGDRPAIAAARAAAGRSGYYQARLVDRSLAAFDRALAGDRKGAAYDLVKLEDFCLGEDTCNSFTPQGDVHRLAAAEWLEDAKDAKTAKRLLLIWVGGGRVPLTGWWWTFGNALSGPAYLLRARLEESLGSLEEAAEFYHLFLRNYDQPGASQAHLVEEARAALVRLGTDR
jgi:tetratricopeptide (TPR) repeat protein/TolB-like protein